MKHCLFPHIRNLPPDEAAAFAQFIACVLDPRKDAAPEAVEYAGEFMCLGLNALVAANEKRDGTH